MKIAVIATSLQDFGCSIIKNPPAKNIIRFYEIDFIYIYNKNGFDGQNFDGVLITDEAKQISQLWELYKNSWMYISRNLKTIREKHDLVYNIHSQKKSWCETCKCHIYNEESQILGYHFKYVIQTP